MIRFPKLSVLGRSCGERTTAVSGITFFVAALVSAADVQATELRVVVDGIRGDKAKIMVALHTPKPNVKFPDSAGTVAAQWRTAGIGKLEFVFADLPPGRFAVAAYHDENDNDVLDVNLIGIPKEGYAFSQNARGFAGPPSFDAAAVKISDEDGPSATSATLGY